MLSISQIQSELSLAYLHALSVSCGYSVETPRIDMDSVDAVISASGKLHATSILKSPRIEVQLKATTRCVVNNQGELSFPLEIKNYDDLRVKTVVPRLLVVFCMPADQSDWITCSPDELILRKCAYYLNLEGMEESSNSTSVTVRLPLANLLNPDSLKRLMLNASLMFRL